MVLCDFVGHRDGYKGTIGVANILKISCFKYFNLKKYSTQFNHNLHKVLKLSVSLNSKNMNAEGFLWACWWGVLIFFFF